MDQADPVRLKADTTYVVGLLGSGAVVLDDVTEHLSAGGPAAPGAGVAAFVDDEACVVGAQSLDGLARQGDDRRVRRNTPAR